MENKISAGDRTLGKLRTEFGASQSVIDEFEAELETVKNTLSKTATNLDTKRAEIGQLQKEIVSKRRRNERFKAQKAQVEGDLEKHFQYTDNMEDRAKQVKSLKYNLKSS